MLVMSVDSKFIVCQHLFIIILKCDTCLHIYKLCQGYCVISGGSSLDLAVC